MVNEESLFETQKKHINHAIALMGRLGAPEKACAHVAAIFLIKAIQDAWIDTYEAYRSGYAHQNGEGDDDTQNEELASQPHLRVIPTARFDYLLKHAGDHEIPKLIDEVILDLEEGNYEILNGIFDGVSFVQNYGQGIRGWPKVFEEVFNVFARPEFNLRPSVVGDDISSVMYAGVLDVINEASGDSRSGQLPIEVAELVAGILDPHDGDEIYDPVCGTGGFLLACGRHIRESDPNAENYHLSGQELLPGNCAGARLGALLAGEDSFDVKPGDFFRSPAFTSDECSIKKFDVVVTQDSISVDGYGDLVASDDRYRRFTRGIPPKAKGEYVLLSHIVESLKDDGGRGAALFSHGVLFREGNEAEIRERIIEENLIDAVIGLPPKLIPRFPQPIVMLVLRKNREDRGILFIDASKKFLAAKSRNRIPVSDAESIIFKYRDRLHDSVESRFVSLEELRANNYNLQIARYIDDGTEASVLKIDSLASERVAYIKDLKVISESVDEILSRVGSS